MFRKKKQELSKDLLPRRRLRNYSAFQSKRPHGASCADRWVRAYGGEELFSSSQLWRAWFLQPYQLTHLVQLQSFAFRTMYRTIPCRVYLNQIKVSDSESCPRCADRDDLFHFFFECQCIKEFWDSLATWMGGFIYKTTVFLQGEPDLLQFLLELKNRLSVERLCCFADHSYDKRFKKWQLFYDDF